MTSIRHVLYIWRWWLIAFVDTRSLQIDNRMLPAAGTITYRWLNPIRLSYMHASAAYCAPFHNGNDTRRPYFFSTIFYWLYSIASFNISKFCCDKCTFYVYHPIPYWIIEFLHAMYKQFAWPLQQKSVIILCPVLTEYFAKLWKWKHIFECICSSIHSSTAL